MEQQTEKPITNNQENVNSTNPVEEKKDQQVQNKELANDSNIQKQNLDLEQTTKSNKYEQNTQEQKMEIQEKASSASNENIVIKKLNERINLLKKDQNDVPQVEKPIIKTRQLHTKVKKDLTAKGSQEQSLQTELNNAYKKIELLNSQVNSLKFGNKKVTDSLDFQKMKEMESKIKIYEKIIKDQEQDIKHLNKQNSDFEKELSSKKLSMQLNSELKSLINEIELLKVENKKLQESNEILEKQFKKRNDYQQQLETRYKEICDLYSIPTNVKTSVEEFIKQNQNENSPIKLPKKIKKMKQKVITENEQVLLNYKRKVDESENTINGLKRQVKQAKLEIDQLKNQLQKHELENQYQDIAQQNYQNQISQLINHNNLLKYQMQQLKSATKFQHLENKPTTSTQQQQGEDPNIDQKQEQIQLEEYINNYKNNLSLSIEKKKASKKLSENKMQRKWILSTNISPVARKDQIGNINMGTQQFNDFKDIESQFQDKKQEGYSPSNFKIVRIVIYNDEFNILGIQCYYQSLKGKEVIEGKLNTYTTDISQFQKHDIQLQSDDYLKNIKCSLDNIQQIQGLALYTENGQSYQIGNCSDLQQFQLESNEIPTFIFGGFNCQTSPQTKKTKSILSFIGFSIGRDKIFTNEKKGFKKRSETLFDDQVKRKRNLKITKSIQQSINLNLYGNANQSPPITDTNTTSLVVDSKRQNEKPTDSIKQEEQHFIQQSENQTAQQSAAQTVQQSAQQSLEQSALIQSESQQNQQTKEQITQKLDNQNDQQQDQQSIQQPVSQEVQQKKQQEDGQYNKQQQQQQEVQLKQPEEVQLKQPEEVQLKQPEEAQLKQPEEAQLKQPEETQLKQPEEVQLKQPEETQLKPQEEIQLKQPEEVQLKPQEEIQLKQPEEVQLKQLEETQLKPQEEIQLKSQESAEQKPIQEQIQEQAQLEIHQDKKQIGETVKEVVEDIMSKVTEKK